MPIRRAYKWWAKLKSQFNYDITITTGNLVTSVTGPSRINNLETFTYTVVFDHNDDCQFKTVTATNCTCTYEGHTITITNVTGPVTLDVVGQYIPVNISLVYVGANKLTKFFHEIGIFYTDVDGQSKTYTAIDYNYDGKYLGKDLVVAKGTSIHIGISPYYWWGQSSGEKEVAYHFEWPLSPTQTDSYTRYLYPDSHPPYGAAVAGNGFSQDLDEAFEGALFKVTTSQRKI